MLVINQWRFSMLIKTVQSAQFPMTIELFSKYIQVVLLPMVYSLYFVVTRHFFPLRFYVTSFYIYSFLYNSWWQYFLSATRRRSHPFSANSQCWLEKCNRFISSVACLVVFYNFDAGYVLTTLVTWILFLDWFNIHINRNMNHRTLRVWNFDIVK